MAPAQELNTLVPVDIAVGLVESYLRLTGYLTLSEFEVQAQRADGGFDTLTDIDIMAIRFPGDVFAGDPHDPASARMLLLEDPELRLEPDQIDVIIGEVKQGQAEFNPGIRRHKVLHPLLRRVEWLFAEGIHGVVHDLIERDVSVTPARGGGTVRARLVAFGRAPACDLNILPHTHVVETMLRFFDDLEEAFRPVQFRDAAPAMLSLLRKSGFQVRQDSAD